MKPDRQLSLYFTIIGILLIVIAALFSFMDTSNTWSLPLVTIFGAIGGVFISSVVAKILNSDPLEEVITSFEETDKYISTELNRLKRSLEETQQDILTELENVETRHSDALRQFQNARISSSLDTATGKQLRDLPSKKLYRYFETLNESGESEWWMKELNFYISLDRKRVYSNSTYYFAENSSKNYQYMIQAALIGDCFILISEEVDGLDKPMVEIYPKFKTGPKVIFPGVSMRYPWNMQDTLVCDYCILAEDILISDDIWQKQRAEGYWKLSPSNKMEAQNKLRDLWKETITRDSDFFSSLMSFKRG